MLWKKISREDEYEGSPMLNKLIDSHIQIKILEINYLDVKREEQIIPGRGNSKCRVWNKFEKDQKGY